MTNTNLFQYFQFRSICIALEYINYLTQCLMRIVTIIYLSESNKKLNFYKLFSTIIQSQERTKMEEELRVTAKQMGIHSNNIANLVIEDISLKNFPAKPLEGYFLAHIYWSIYYKFVPRPGSAKGVFPMVVAQPEISPKSWMNTKCADNCLIQHQYGHYLIACWCALEFQQTVNYGYQILSNTTTVDQYKDWCASVFRSTLKKYCAIERLYDQETQHYCDQERQAEWEKKIVSHINEYDKKSKERAKQKIQGQFKQANKFESKRAFSQHKPKKEVNQSSFKPRIPASGYRIRPAGMPIRPIKVA